MAGTNANLHNEGRRIVAALGADAWLVADGASGPFTTSTPIPVADADRVAAMPGVVRADPLVILHSTLRRPAVRGVNFIGAARLPRDAAAGGGPCGQGVGEVVADTALGLRPGDRVGDDAAVGTGGDPAAHGRHDRRSATTVSTRPSSAPARRR